MTISSKLDFDSIPISLFCRTYSGIGGTYRPVSNASKSKCSGHIKASTVGIAHFLKARLFLRTLLQEHIFFIGRLERSRHPPKPRSVAPVQPIIHACLLQPLGSASPSNRAESRGNERQSGVHYKAWQARRKLRIYLNSQKPDCYPG